VSCLGRNGFLSAYTATIPEKTSYCEAAPRARLAEDADELAAASAELPPDAHRDLYRMLIVAINEDRLLPEPGVSIH
jgi:hypothetical protein